MRNIDIVLLLGAGVVAYFLVREASKATASAAAAAAPSNTLTSETLGWYLNDIYNRLPA